MEKTDVYLGGKVSGLAPDEYKKKFRDCSQWLQDQLGEGHTVVIPIGLCEDDWSWFKCMEVCVPRLTECATLYLMSDWKDSHGATAEYFVAHASGIPVVEVPECYQDANLADCPLI